MSSRILVALPTQGPALCTVSKRSIDLSSPKFLIMNRRLFAYQVTAGLSVCLLPHSLVASPLMARFHEPPAPDLARTNDVTSFVQGGLIGTIQQVALSYAYSPERTVLPTLLNQVERDFEQLSRVLGKSLVIDVNQLLVDSPSAVFGSYSAQFDLDGLTFVWQGLARTGGADRSTSATLRLCGSRGSVLTTTNYQGYHVVDLRGKTIRQTRS